ncbi:MAG: thiamine biosynthesis protein ApbE [Gammaproteobacteria bacterium HGW-Gammaproteobacteria-10]|nr:MAG: thiamine biosynthesis protein ApbE [Gammaproteobacteria bacterium HGW-Gammaproteobacteria-10]
MGTPCEIQLFAGSHKIAQHVAGIVIADVERLEQRYSRYRPDSFLSEINTAAARGGSIDVDSETAGLLNYALTCYEQSDGLFDISSGILRQAWRFDRESLPEEPQIQALLDKIGWHKIDWMPPKLTFSVPGMELDFGGIVKEYAVDRAAGLCLQAGIKHGLINLGGDIKLIGPRPDGSPWQVGIAHPRQKGEMIQALTLSGGALASSGDYERCLLIDGVRYGHVLNPKTGWPVRYMASVSVIGDFCVVSGSAATIAMLKEEQGPEWLESLGLPCLWIDVHGNVGGSLIES